MMEKSKINQLFNDYLADQYDYYYRQGRDVHYESYRGSTCIGWHGFMAGRETLKGLTISCSCCGLEKTF